jgi:hypothetical protein
MSAQGGEVTRVELVAMLQQTSEVEHALTFQRWCDLRPRPTPAP